MAFIGLAPFPSQLKYTSDTKFCFGDDCNKDLPKSDFPKSGGRYCKKCTSKRFSEKRRRMIEDSNPFKK